MEIIFGERPEQILIKSFFAIVIFAVAYGVFDGVEGAGGGNILENCRDYIYFSLVTFTTLGYGDMRPIGWWRVVAAFEAAFGAFSMAFFVVSWARKVMR